MRGKREVPVVESRGGARLRAAENSVESPTEEAVAAILLNKRRAARTKEVPAVAEKGEAVATSDAPKKARTRKKTPAVAEETAQEASPVAKRTRDTVASLRARLQKYQDEFTTQSTQMAQDLAKAVELEKGGRVRTGVVAGTAGLGGGYLLGDSFAEKQASAYLCGYLSKSAGAPAVAEVPSMLQRLLLQVKNGKVALQTKATALDQLLAEHPKLAAAIMGTGGLGAGVGVGELSDDE
jgi:hypothetical protein